MNLSILKKRFLLALGLLLTFTIPSSLMAQDNLFVEGYVTDVNTGEALLGVSIAEKGTANGTITDGNGRYRLSNVSKSAIIVFSYIGYNTTEVKFSTNKLDLQLQPSANMMEDVVVIGYGSVKRKDVTT